MWWWQESTVLRPILFNSVLTDFAFITENGHQSSIYTINNGKHYKSVLLIGEPLTSMQLITLEKSTTNSELRVLQIGTTAKFKQQMHSIICKEHTRCNQNTFSHWTQLCCRGRNLNCHGSASPNSATIASNLQVVATCYCFLPPDILKFLNTYQTILSNFLGFNLQRK